MNDLFFVAAILTPLMVLVAATVVVITGLRQNDRDRRLARERGELPPR